MSRGSAGDLSRYMAVINLIWNNLFRSADGKPLPNRQLASAALRNCRETSPTDGSHPSFNRRNVRNGKKAVYKTGTEFFVVVVVFAFVISSLICCPSLPNICSYLLSYCIVCSVAYCGFFFFLSAVSQSTTQFIVSDGLK